MGRWIACALLIIVIGCGGGTDKPPPPAIDLAGLEELRAGDIAAKCDYLTRCGLFDSHATCTTYFVAPDDRSLAAAIAEKAVGYDAAAAAACQEQTSAQSCDHTIREGRTPEVCNQIFTGLVPTDETCGFDLECSSGSCLLPGCPAGQCCPGGCNAGEAGQVGASCQSDLQCVAETFCNPDRVCAALSGAGAVCRKDSHCGFGLGCVGKTALEDGSCKALPPIGQPCPDDACAEAGAICDSNKICVAAGLLGAPCPTGIECSSFLVCGASGTCEDTPQLGMPCVDTCAGAAWCSAGSCVAPQADAASCTIAGKGSKECESQFCLEGPFFSQCATTPVCF